MRGERVKTTPTTDGLLDVFATVNDNVVRVLAGTRSRPGDWAIDIVGLPNEGKASIKTVAFGIVDGDRFKQVDGPSDLGEREQQIDQGRLRIPMHHADPATAFAFEVTF